MRLSGIPSLPTCGKRTAVPLLCCPRCGGQMKIVAFITEEKLIQHILVHLGLWKNKPSSDPPTTVKNKQIIELAYGPVFDDWPIYEEPCFQIRDAEKIKYPT